MKKAKVRTFRGRLREDLEDPEFKARYNEERQALKLAMKIIKLREKKGLSQKQLATLMGASEQAISRIERGEYEGFTFKTLGKLAKSTGMRVRKTIKDKSPTKSLVHSKAIAEALGAEETTADIATDQGPISLFALRKFLVGRLRSVGGRSRLGGTEERRRKISLCIEDWEKLEHLAKYYRESEGINIRPPDLWEFDLIPICRRDEDLCRGNTFLLR